MNPELETPSPGVIRRRDRRFSDSDPQRLLWVLLWGSCKDLFEFQLLTFVGHHQGTIEPILDHHFRTPQMILDLVELLVVSHRKIIAQRPLCLDT